MDFKLVIQFWLLNITNPKFENGEFKGKVGTMGKEMNDQMQGFLKHLQDQNKKKNSGCLGVALILFVFSAGLLYGTLKIIF